MAFAPWSPMARFVSTSSFSSRSAKPTIAATTAAASTAVAATYSFID